MDKITRRGFIISTSTLAAWSFMPAFSSPSFPSDDNAHSKNPISGVDQNIVQSGLVAAIDLGTTKACCLIAKPAGEDGYEVIGIGHQISQGLRSGTIIDVEKAEATIRSTVEAAEQMAGENICEVIVNISCGKPQSRLITRKASISGHEVGDHDLKRLLDPAGLAQAEKNERQLIHVIPVDYNIDGNKGIRDPRGMYGKRLGVNMHIISAATGPLRRLELVIQRCHLGVCGKVVSPYASGLACVSVDEKNLGVTCIDMGGGTTSISVFRDDELIHTDFLPIGGVHLTNDIAQGLSTPMVHAERMKTVYGSAIPRLSGDHEIIKVPLIGEEKAGATKQVRRSALVDIIRPRLEETLEMVRYRLAEAGFDRFAGHRVVLTGGASQLPGLRELAGSILGKQVRIGRPGPVPGLTELVSGPAFSTAVGLLRFAFNNPANFTLGAKNRGR